MELIDQKVSAIDFIMPILYTFVDQMITSYGFGKELELSGHRFCRRVPLVLLKLFYVVKGAQIP